MFFVLLNCESDNKEIQSVEIMFYDYFINSDIPDWKLYPYSYSLIKSNGEIFHFISESMAKKDFKFSQSKIDRAALDDFIKYCDSANVGSEINSDKITIRNSPRLAKITYKDKTFKMLYISQKQNNQSLIKYLDYYQRDHTRIADSLSNASITQKHVNFDTLAFKISLEKFIKFAILEDSINYKKPPKQTKEHDILFHK